MNTTYNRDVDPRKAHTRAAEPAASLLGPRLGLTARDLDRFDLGSLIRAAASGDTSRLGLMNEISAATEKATGRSVTAANSWLLPTDVLERRQTRDMTSVNSGNLIAMEQPGFVEAFGVASLVDVLPVRRLSLTGNASVPIGNWSWASWLAEDGVSEATTTEPTVGQATLSPRTCAAVVRMSHQMRATAPTAVSFVESMLGTALGREVGQALLAGSGLAGEPRSVFAAPGVNTVTGAGWTHSQTLSMIRHCEGFVGANPDSVRIVASPAAAMYMRAAASFAAADVAAGTFCGHPLVVYGASPDGRAYAAAWDSVIVASWGAIELTVSPYGVGASSDFSKGVITARIMGTFDFVSFSPTHLAVSDAELS